MPASPARQPPRLPAKALTSQVAAPRILQAARQPLVAAVPPTSTVRPPGGAPGALPGTRTPGLTPTANPSALFAPSPHLPDTTSARVEALLGQLIAVVSRDPKPNTARDLSDGPTSLVWDAASMDATPAWLGGKRL